VRICARHCFPVIAYGAGSSLEGQLAAVEVGCPFDLTAMDRVLEVNATDLDVKVEAGVTREALNAELRSLGLFFPLDPGANATLGGMAATRASGTNAVRYGTMREVTLRLNSGYRCWRCDPNWALAPQVIGWRRLDAALCRVGGHARHYYRLWLRVFGLPEQIASAVVQFNTLEDAVQSVMVVMQLGIPVARIELLDEFQMQACICLFEAE